MLSLADLLHVQNRAATLGCATVICFLILSYHIAQPADALVAIGAAIAVGMGEGMLLRWQRLMHVVGIFLATIIGSYTGLHEALQTSLIIVGAAVVGIASISTQRYWWMLLQIWLFFTISGAYAHSAETGLDRAGMVFIGGFAQWISLEMIPLLWFTITGHSLLKPPADRNAPTFTVPTLVWHAIRALLAVAGAMWLVSALALQNGYWAPLTAMLVLKAKAHDTTKAAMQSLAATFAGALVATIFAELVGLDNKTWLTVGFVSSLWVAYGFKSLNYTVFSAALTATLVLMLSLFIDSVITNAEHRLLATLIGGVVAVISCWLTYTIETWMKLPRSKYRPKPSTDKRESR